VIDDLDTRVEVVDREFGRDVSVRPFRFPSVPAEGIEGNPKAKRSRRNAAPQNYARLVAPRAELEDERGVDRAQIRELLALTPEERVARLVATVNIWIEIRAHVGTTSTAR
jgi:hypothetical protein